MSDSDQLDVLIALYLIPDLAKQDFDGLMQLIEDKAVSGDGVVLVTKDADGIVHLEGGATMGGGVGALVGAFGKVTRQRVRAKIGEKMDEALPAGSAAVIAAYDHEHAGTVAGALANAIRSSAAQIDTLTPKNLQAGLEAAAAGLGG
jgi:O-acetyl-ADP-ribose deacetylase (regulator of RNase III)